MGERVSIIKLLGLPETFAVMLLTFSFILLLAPYFSGADFGLFKIPQFTDHARKKLKITGPIVFLLLLLLFVPLIAQNVPTAPSNINQTSLDNKQNNSTNAPANNESDLAKPADTHNQILRHIERAHTLFEQANYEDALKECDKALNLDPKNQAALDLKKRINTTIEILNRNRNP